MTNRSAVPPSRKSSIQLTDDPGGVGVGLEQQADLGGEPRHQQGGRHPFPRDVAERDRPAIPAGRGRLAVDGVSRPVVEVITPDEQGGLIGVPELVPGQGWSPLGDQGPLHLPCVPSLLFQLLVTDGHLMQPGILHGHAHHFGHGDQEVEVAPTEPRPAVLGVDLEDADRSPFVVPERDAERRAGFRLQDAPALLEPAVRGDVLTEDRPPFARDVVVDRPADGRVRGFGMAELSWPSLGSSRSPRP